MDAELVLDAGAAQVVARPERAIGVDEEFGREEQRQAARAGRRAGQAGKNEMDDVLGHVVLAIGDEDLLAEQAIGSVLGALRPGPHRVEIGPRLRLGQVHGPGPFARDHRSEIGVEQFARSERLEGVDGALGQKRAERKRHRGAVPDFGAGDVDEMRQAHAAELGRRGDAVPARLRPPPVDVGETGRRPHHPIFINRAGKIADPVQGRDLLLGEAPRLPDDGPDRVPVEIAGQPPPDHAGQIGDRAQRKKDVGDRRTIRHFFAPPSPTGARATRPGIGMRACLCKSRLRAMRCPHGAEGALIACGATEISQGCAQKAHAFCGTPSLS